MTHDEPDQDDWEVLRRLTDADGDSIEFAIADGIVDVSIKQGPREVCCLALTATQLDVLIDRLQRIRRRLEVTTTPREEP